MSDYKLKDDYVAQVVMLTGERNRLRSELAQAKTIKGAFALLVKSIVGKKEVGK